MQFISLQENLKRSLNIVGHATSKNINLPILNNILIRTENGNITLIATNLEIGVTNQLRGKVEKDGEFTVDSKLISEYVNLLSSGEKVLIEKDGNELKVESGKYKTKIKGEDTKEFPLIPSVIKDKPYSCKADKLKEALNSVIFAVSNSENRVELGGVLFSFSGKKLSLAATDSYRLAESIIDISSDNEDEEKKVIVPAKTAAELLRIINSVDPAAFNDSGEVKICLSDNQILFSVDSTDLVSRLINGHYPDYKQIIPNHSQTKVKVDKGELLRAAKATALFSKAGVNDITLCFVKGRVTVSAYSGASGESQADVEAEIEGDDNEVTINYRYLIDGLNNISGEIACLELINNNSPCLLKSIEDNGYLYIVMPIKQ